MNINLSQRIGSFLAAHHVVSLATFGSSGPHASSLFYIVGHKETLEIST
jgi:uncharacterized protein YhbP (UPF0306 family)